MWRNNKYPLLPLFVFCLMPWLGIFLGIGIFLVGAFKYRNVLYSLVGIAGAICSMIVAFGIRYNQMNNEGIQISFQTISQDKLNKLARQLEEYKSSKGSYPDSLDQLLETEIYFFGYDPIQVNQRRKNSKYNYIRNGDKYLLFSAGQDGVAGTFDDIYPDSISQKNIIVN